MKSKNEYENSFSFSRKEILSDLQLQIYRHYLNRKNKNIESVINSYINFINEKIFPNKLIFKLPSNKLNYLEKIRILAPDFEFLLKQYKLLVDENTIDIELIQINSTPIRIGEIYSKKSNKYLYSNNDLILQLKHLFFSDQSHLFYIEPFKNKYKCLYDLLVNEKLKLENFKNYQQGAIQKLIDDQYLKISSDNFITFNKEILIFLLGELHYKEVISYWNYPLPFRKAMDELIEKKLLIEENTLFSRQEREYLNFYLNKKEFTNGYDLRNKYLHGTNSFLEGEHELDYLKLIKIIILTLLKIDDDLTAH